MFAVQRFSKSKEIGLIFSVSFGFSAFGSAEQVKGEMKVNAAIKSHVEAERITETGFVFSCILLLIFFSCGLVLK